MDKPVRHVVIERPFDPTVGIVVKLIEEEGFAVTTASDLGKVFGELGDVNVGPYLLLNVWHPILAMRAAVIDPEAIMALIWKLEIYTLVDDLTVIAIEDPRRAFDPPVSGETEAWRVEIQAELASRFGRLVRRLERTALVGACSWATTLSRTGLPSTCLWGRLHRAIKLVSGEPKGDLVWGCVRPQPWLPPHAVTAAECKECEFWHPRV